jgi:hypothetical protein
MKFALQVLVPAQDMSSASRTSQDSPSLPRKRMHRHLGGDTPSPSGLMRNISDRASSDAWHGPQEVPGLWVAVKRPSDSPDPFREVRSGSTHCTCNVGKSFLGQRRYGSCNDGKQLCRGHSDEGQKVLSSLVFRLCLCSKLSKVLHHCVRIDLADGAYLLFRFTFEFVLILLLA